MQIIEVKAKQEKQVLQKFWDSLKQGRITTLRCRKCGTYMFPPVPICKECLSRDLYWADLSGDGELLYFTSAPMPGKPFLEFAPYAYGAVRFKEGPIFITRIEGVDISSPASIMKGWEKLPRPVKAEFMQVKGLNTIVFRVKG